MKRYLIGYDLDKNNPNYKTIKEEIIKLSKHWWNNLDSTFIILSPKTIEEIFTILKENIDPNNKLLIIEIDDNSSWLSTGFKKEGEEWLKKRL